MTSLRLDAELPLAWTQVSGFDASELQALAHRNEQLLSLLPSLEAPPESDEESPDPRLQAMDFKLHLLLDLVGELLARDTPLPPSLPVSLGATDLKWRQATPPADGTYLTVDVHVHPRFPRALRLAAVVEDVQAVEGGFSITVKLLSLGATFQDQLEKFIFRHHRRSVAEQRRGG